jgi:YLATT-like protein
MRTMVLSLDDCYLLRSALRWPKRLAAIVKSELVENCRSEFLCGGLFEAMNKMWIILIVMSGSGVLGGFMNFFISDPRSERPLTWWQHLVVGVGAALMVPLFLNMISSGLIDTVLGSNGLAPDSSKLFVLAGFCLAAAVTSRAFIQNISERVLREIKDELRDTKKQVREEIKESKEQVVKLSNTVVDSSAEPELISESYASTDAWQEHEPYLSPDELAMLTAMTNTRYSLRTISGLAKDTGLDKATVNAVLTSLVSQGLAGQGLTSKGNPRWYATDTGRTVLALNTHQPEQADTVK